MATEELKEDCTHSVPGNTALTSLLVVARDPGEAHYGDFLGRLAGRDAKTT